MTKEYSWKLILIIKNRARKSKLLVFSFENWKRNIKNFTLHDDAYTGNLIVNLNNYLLAFLPVLVKQNKFKSFKKK